MPKLHNVETTLWDVQEVLQKNKPAEEESEGLNEVELLDVVPMVRIKRSLSVEDWSTQSIWWTLNPKKLGKNGLKWRRTG
ncbi:hypothetical protein B9Z55_027914 [Caenorhabditis nigoni]|uniref:Uncharacterized protein n=1 Tax=Caenorhabditis nigoni TaxID=1611254 RepID=A0A2G5SEE5_9PELO|nr:hypothetical protein B9Z55_027914 [Caenorhabditis nigoni]